MTESDKVLFEKAFQCQDTLISVIFKLTEMRFVAESQEGSSARWIEREITSLLKMIGDKVNG